MTTDRNLEAELERLGSAAGPGLDPAFADRLDAHLRVRHAELSPTGSPGPRARSILIPVATVAVLVVAVLGALLANRGGTAEVVMTVASDTEIHVDGQPPTDGVPGLVLADGTRIVVGPGGEAVVNGVVLAGGSEAVVLGDRVEVVVSVPPDTGGDRPDPIVVAPDPAPTTSAVTASVPPTNGTRPTVSPNDTASTTSPERTTAGPEQPSSSASTSTSTSQTRPTTATTATSRSTTTLPPTSTVATTDATAPTSAPADAVTLVATRAGEARLQLEWSLARDLSPAGWRVRVGRGDRVATLVVLRGPDARSTVVERSAISGAVVWVEALDRRGQVLASSNRLSFR